MRTPPSHSDRSNAAAPASRPALGWPDYFAVVENRPPCETLVRALAEFGREPSPLTPRNAIDLGCGAGRDSLELLRRGWRVLALDGESDGIRRLLARTPPDHAGRLTARVETFEQFITTAHERADLINASYSLPFCPAEHFAALWEAIVGAIRPGGRFCGQFFGPRDEDTIIPSQVRLDRPQIEKLLAPFAVEQFDEDEQDGRNAFGETKHIHRFHIVARLA